MKRWRRCAALGAVMASLGGAGACLPLPPAGVLVVGLGPPPRWDRMGVPPGADYVWVSGYWIWQSDAYSWRPGRWMPLPPGHRYWRPGYWVRTRHGWYYQEGYWD